MELRHGRINILFESFPPTQLVTLIEFPDTGNQTLFDFILYSDSDYLLHSEKNTQTVFCWNSKYIYLIYFVIHILNCYCKKSMSLQFNLSDFSSNDHKWALKHLLLLITRWRQVLTAESRPFSYFNRWRYLLNDIFPLIKPKIKLFI